MARTPEQRGQRKKIAREFRKQFLKQPGRKALQRAASDRSGLEEPPQRSPRGPRPPKPVENWGHLVHRSTSAQRNLLRELERNWRNQQDCGIVMERIEKHRDELVVLDANVLLHGISSLEPDPTAAKITRMVLNEDLIPCVSSGIIREVLGVGERLVKEERELTSQDYRLLEKLFIHAIVVDPLPLEEPVGGRIGLASDQSDAKYLVVARKVNRGLPGNQIPIVTRDHHLLDAPEEVVAGLAIMAPEVFLALVEKKIKRP